MVWSLFGIATYEPSFLSWSIIGPFLVCSPLSLSLFSHLGRHLLNSIQYIVTHVFLYSLASSMHNLPSNLVSLLGLSLVLIPTDFDYHTIALQEQQPLFDNCSTWVLPRLVTFAVALLRGRPPLITVEVQDLQAFAYCRPSKSHKELYMSAHYTWVYTARDVIMQTA